MIAKCPDCAGNVHLGTCLVAAQTRLAALEKAAGSVLASWVVGGNLFEAMNVLEHVLAFGSADGEDEGV